MKDTVDWFWIVRPASRVERSSGGQERLDGFVMEDEQRRHCSEPGWERFVSAGVTDPANDLFATKLLEIISCVSGAVV